MPRSSQASLHKDKDRTPPCAKSAWRVTDCKQSGEAGENGSSIAQQSVDGPGEMGQGRVPARPGLGG